MKYQTCSTLTVTPPSRYDFSEDDGSDDALLDDAVAAPESTCQQPTLQFATIAFLKHFTSAQGVITVPHVQQQVKLPLKDVHALLAILEVLEVRPVYNAGGFFQLRVECWCNQCLQLGSTSWCFHQTIITVCSSRSASWLPQRLAGSSSAHHAGHCASRQWILVAWNESCQHALTVRQVQR
jgi:hypothetical protein